MSAGYPQSPFTAVIFEGSGLIAGTIHEAMKLPYGQSQQANAALEGTVDGSRVHFVKTYDGTGGQHHAVTYDGQLNGDRSEIEGQWHIRSPYGAGSGRFLMIRARRATTAATKSVSEKV